MMKNAEIWRDQWSINSKRRLNSRLLHLESRLCWSDKWCSSYSIFMWRLDSDLHWLDKIVTAIHMTVTAVWYDMTNDSERLMTLTVLIQWDMWIDKASWAEVNKQRLTRDSWAAVSSVDDGQMSMSWDSWQQETSDWWVDVTISFDCKCKLVLLLRLGYLKPFLAGSKKTRQGPGCRVGALHISRCWFYLTVVAKPKLIQKYYKIIWCCVLCVMVLDDLNAMICDWWSLWNDYEIGRIMEWWFGS